MPTWVDDVEPILRANCFGCHGWLPPEIPRNGATRFDVYAPEEDWYGALPDGYTPAKHPLMFTKIELLTREGVLDDSRMPPPPAPLLSAHERAVLAGWKQAGFPRGTRGPNHAPTVGWLVRPRTFVIADADREQLLGKVVCAGDATAVLDRSGAWPAPGQPPCEVSVSDGVKETVETLR